MGLWVPRAQGVDLGAWCPAGRAPQFPQAVTTRCQVRSSTVLVLVLFLCDVKFSMYSFISLCLIKWLGEGTDLHLTGDFAASARAFNAVHTYSSLLSVTWMCSPLTLTWIKLKWFKYIFWTNRGWPSIHQILISRRLWYCFWVEQHRKVGRCCCHSGGQWKLSVPLKNQVLPSGTGLLFLIWKLGSPRELRKSAYFSAGSLFFQEFSSKIVFLPF